jgi:hypothetical protein
VTWRSLDDVFNEPRVARAGGPVTSWMADFLDRPDGPSDRAVDRQISAMFGMGRDALSSPDREVRTMMSVDPGSFRMGPPGSRRRVERRPLRLLVDDWLAAGGWYGGVDTAGSVALAEPDSDAARKSLRYRWRAEVLARGWRPRWFRAEIHDDDADGEVRMYWRTMPQHVPAGPPVMGEFVAATLTELARPEFELDDVVRAEATEIVAEHLLVRRRNARVACDVDNESWPCAAMLRMAELTGIELPEAP